MRAGRAMLERQELHIPGQCRLHAASVSGHGNTTSKRRRPGAHKMPSGDMYSRSARHGVMRGKHGKECVQLSVARPKARLHTDTSDVGPRAGFQTMEPLIAPGGCPGGGTRQASDCICRMRGARVPRQRPRASARCRRIAHAPVGADLLELGPCLAELGRSRNMQTRATLLHGLGGMPRRWQPVLSPRTPAL